MKWNVKARVNVKAGVNVEARVNVEAWMDAKSRVKVKLALKAQVNAVETVIAAGCCSSCLRRYGDPARRRMRFSAQLTCGLPQVGNVRPTTPEGVGRCGRAAAPLSAVPAGPGGQADTAAKRLSGYNR
ncbi:hypothetical protein ACWD6P_19050 [Streptomyces sp. NPDC002446]